MQPFSNRVLKSATVALCISAAAVVLVTFAWVGIELHRTAVTLSSGTAMGWDPVSFYRSERVPILGLAAVVFVASFAAMNRRFSRRPN